MYASELLDAGMEPTWAHERRFQLHRKKLQQIRGRSLVPATQPVSATRTSLPRLKALSFLEAERQEAIKRENALLMQKLVTIAEGKKLRKARRSLEPRSLNEYLRKKEEDRIKTENEAFSRRLLEKGGEISKRKLDLSFFESQRYMRQISKAQILKSQLKGVRPNPLTDSDSETKGNGSAREQLSKRSPKAYARPNELSPLNRTAPVRELEGLREKAMDTKGEVAVLVEGKKTQRRAKGLNETAEGRMQGKQLQASMLTQPLSKKTDKRATEATGSGRKPAPPVVPKSTSKKGEQMLETEAGNQLSELPARSPPLPEETAPLPEKTAHLPEQTASLPEETAPLPGETAPLPEQTVPLPEQTVLLSEQAKEATAQETAPMQAPIETAFESSPQEPPVSSATELPKSSAEAVVQDSVEQTESHAENQAPLPVPGTEIKPEPVQEAPLESSA